MVCKIVFKAIIYIILLGGFTHCTVKPTEKMVYNCKCAEQTFAILALPTLIKNPNAYDSKLIEIEGFYRSEFERSALYRNRTNEEEGRALWLDFDGIDSLIEVNSHINLIETPAEFEKINQRRIRVRGTFNMKLTGHLGLYFGGIENICLLEIL